MRASSSERGAAVRRRRGSPSGSELVLAVDVGTSAVKAFLLDPDGCQWWVAAQSLRLSFGSGRVEIAPAAWWSASRQVITEVLSAGRADAASIGHVVVTGNMSSVVLLDRRGKPVREAILLADARGGSQLDGLGRSLRNRVAALTGNPLNSSFSLAKLLWLLANEPANLEAAAVWLSAKDYVRYRLSGVVASDPSDAYNSLVLDPSGFCWRNDLIEKVGLDPAIFPPVLPGTDKAGGVTPAAAAVTGVAPGTPVLTGLGDMAALACGVGWLDAARPAVSLGTSTTLLLPAEAGSRPAPGFSVHPVLPERPWFVLGSLLTGGLALDWLRRLGPTGAPAARRRGEVAFLPQLSGRGSPHFDARWRGTIFGLDPSTGIDELVRATFDAVAFELRSCLAELSARPLESLVISGGGSAVTAWLQSIADVLEVEVQVLQVPDATAFGAALCALAPERAAGLVRRVLGGTPVRPRADWDVHRAFDRYQAAQCAAARYYAATDDDPQARRTS